MGKGNGGVEEHREVFRVGKREHVSLLTEASRSRREVEDTGERELFSFHLQSSFDSPTP